MRLLEQEATSDRGRYKVEQVETRSRQRLAFGLRKEFCSSSKSLSPSARSATTSPSRIAFFTSSDWAASTRNGKAANVQSLRDCGFVRTTSGCPRSGRRCDSRPSLISCSHSLPSGACRRERLQAAASTCGAAWPPPCVVDLALLVAYLSVTAPRRGQNTGGNLLHVAANSRSRLQRAASSRMSVVLASASFSSVMSSYIAVYPCRRAIDRRRTSTSVQPPQFLTVEDELELALRRSRPQRSRRPVPKCRCPRESRCRRRIRPSGSAPSNEP